MREMPTLGLRRSIGALMAAMVLFSAVACSDTPAESQQSSWTPVSSAPTTTGEPETEAGESEQPIPNDLARLPLKRRIESGPVAVDVEYTTPLRLADWRSDRSKPLRIKLTAVNKGQRKQKIYLTKVSANVTAYDDVGQVGDASSVTDEAKINPGFIVTSPNSYNQSLSLPTFDSGSLWMTVDLTYEMALEVDKTKEGRDFAKQVATDTITVPLAR